MANYYLKILIAHLLFLLDGLQRSFWNYAPQPLLSAILPLLLETGPKPSPIVYVPQAHDPSTYTNPIDLPMKCLLPTIFQIPLAVNLTCSVGHPDYDQDDFFPVEPERPSFYMFLDSTPVQGEDESLSLAHPERQTDLDSYGARGLSFCPVLVGVSYLHSLLHLYMFIMIPSFVNHWFEDVSFYESLNPTGLSGYPRLLYTSLSMTPWYHVRYGLRRVLSRLYHCLRWATHKSARPSIPRIVLIRVDGEAVPVHFIGDSPASRVDVDERQTFEFEDSETRNNRDKLSDGRDADGVLPPQVSDNGSLIATGFEVVPISIFSQQGDGQGGISNSHDRIKPGPNILDAFTEVSQHVVTNSGIRDEQWETSPNVFRTGNEPLQHVEESHNFGQVGQVTFPDGVIDDDPREDTNCLGEQEDSNRDVDSSSQNFIDDCGPYETETSSTSLSATISSVESQEMMVPAKNVRFAVDVNVTDERQAISSTTHMEKCTDSGETWDLGILFGDDHDTPMESPSDPPMDIALPVPEQDFQGDNIDQQGTNGIVAETWPPFLIEEPIVNLPALVMAREDGEAVDMDPMVHAALIEDVATRSPFQTLSPNVPAVVINTNCPIDKEQPLTIAISKLALDLKGSLKTLNEEAGVRSDFTSPSQHRSWLASPSVEGRHPICCPTTERKSSNSDRLTETTFPDSAPVSETGFSFESVHVATDVSPSDARNVPGTNGIETEVTIHETPRQRGLLDAKCPPKNDFRLQGSKTSHFEAVAADSLAEPGTGYVISGQSPDFPCTLVLEPMVEPPKHALRSPDTHEDSILLSTPHTERTTDELCYRKVMLWERLATTPQPCSQRTLSSSMHAPMGPELPQANNNPDEASGPNESAPSARSKDAEERTVVENASEQVQDLFASIHAPKRVPQHEGPPLEFDPREGGCDHCRSVTSPVAVSEGEPSTKPGSPNWVTMPVDAFRTFKQPHSENGIRRASSISEGTNRGPMAGIVCQKGVATNSLNNTSTIASIQGRWMRGGGLLLVRDLMPSDPADFNLRTCTNLRSSKIRCMKMLPLQLGQFNISPIVSRDEMTRHPVGTEADFRALVVASAESRQ